MSKVFDVLCKKLKVKPEAGEAYPVFADRVTKKINRLDDTAWKELGNPIQEWSNEVLKALEAEQELPALEGWPETASADEGGATDDDEGGEETAPADDENDSPADGEGDADGSEDGEPAEDAEDGNDSPEETVDEPAQVGQEDTSEADAAPAPRSSRRRSGKKKPASEPAETEAKASGKPAPKTTEKTKAKTADKKPGAPAKVAAAPVKEPAGKEKSMATKTAKKAVAKKAAAKSARTGVGRLSDNDRIRVLASGNPYRDGTIGHKAFAKYKDGMTVKTFAGAIAKLDTERKPAALLRYDVGKGHVKIEKAAA